ncbi:MAG: putative efflux system component YknX [Verrucomicrobiota bacterium]|jgi:HlyD family secretion protein
MNPTAPHPPRNGPAPSRWRRLRRGIPWLGAALLVALLAFGLSPRPAPVETGRVVTGPLRTSVNEEGKTRIRQRYVVAAPVTGQLRRIPFKAGALLQSTSVVVAVVEPLPPALLDARTRALAEARRDSAAAQLERAKAQHEYTQTELKRAQQLVRAGTASPQELDKAQWNDVSAGREEAAAAAALRQAEAELAEFDVPIGAPRPPVELRAPVCGKVLRVFEESARVVPAGTPLLEVGDPADLEVLVEVLSRDGAAIQPGTPAELEQWGGGEPLRARVRHVEPAAFTKVSALGVEEQRVYVVADLLTPPEQRGNLGDNFRVEARIITWQADRVLKVPSGALFRRGSQWHAYVVEDGRARLRPVKVGHGSGIETEILEGLQEGEQVILYPGDRVEEGRRVRPVTI